MDAAEPRPGRPRRSSREMLQEAAAELFLERGYAATSVEQIASRAGVSRNTFFNYFGGKPDVLWAAADELLAELESRLLTHPVREASVSAAVQIVAEVLRAPAAGALPLTLTQGEAMGVDAQVGEAGLRRLARAGDLLHGFLSRAVAPTEALAVRASAYAITAVATAAVQEWAGAGVGRGALADVFLRAWAALETGEPLLHRPS